MENIQTEDNLTITIGEFIRWRQPELSRLLAEYGLGAGPMAEDALKSNRQMEEKHSFAWWKKLMEGVPGFNRIAPREKRKPSKPNKPY